MSFFKWLFFLIVLFIRIPYAYSSTFVPVEDETYQILFRLEAEGIIQSSMLTTLPLSRTEIVRLIHEAEKNAEEKSSFIKGQIEFLKDKYRDDLETDTYIKPVDKASIRYIYSDRGSMGLIYNNNGDGYDDGSNARFGISSRAELGWISFDLDPEVRYSEKDTDVIMQRGYGVMNLAGIELEAGKDSQWWGPGYHGSLLLSNNAEPFTMVKLNNAEPILLPSVFKYLGLFKFTVFATRLEEERNDVPEPYLWGMRFNFKPMPYIEIGLERTAILGGQGRSDDLSAWWKSFTGEGENESGVEAGDQRAGGDLKITLPFSWQPLQFYMEAAGEDEANKLPTKWAYLAGIYLPRIFTFEKMSFRAEYAKTTDDWYIHHIYTDGYTYNDSIIGHHMGADSRDIFLELGYVFPSINAKASIAYEREEHNLSAETSSVKDEVSLGMKIGVSKDMSIEGVYALGWFKDYDTADDQAHLLIFGMSYDF